MDETTLIYRADGTVERSVAPLPRVRDITPLEFMSRLPAETQAGIAGAALQSPPVLLLLLRLVGASRVDLDAEETVAGVAALRAAGLLTEAEAGAVLA